jgi:hypothetical protein
MRGQVPTRTSAVEFFCFANRDLKKQTTTTITTSQQQQRPSTTAAKAAVIG